MPTNPPANPLSGAVYVDQTTNITWVWTGVYWLQAMGGSQNYNAQQQPTTTIIPGYYSDPSPDDWVPFVSGTQPLYPGCGQLWINNSVSPATASVWDCNTSAWISITGTAGGDTNSIVSSSTPAVRVDGSALQSGDLWIDNVNTRMYYYTGSSFVSLTSPDTHSILSTVTPTTRPDGSTSFLAGDLWVDSDDNSISYYNGATWEKVKAEDPSHQLATSAPLTRSDGSPLQVADLYTNTANYSLSYWNGVSWQRYVDLMAIENTAQPLTRPDGSPLEGGDQWFNPTTDVLSVYESGTSTWISITGTDTHTVWSGTAPSARNNGTTLINGDLWVDTSVDSYGYHSIKVYNAGSWENVGDLDTHAFVGSGAPTLTARPNGDALLVGDFYVNSIDDSIYYYNGTWQQTFKANDTHSFYGTGLPNVVLPAGNLRPDNTPLQGGDHYVDNTTDYLYYWNGVNWVLVKSFAPDTHSFVYTSATPTATVRPDGTSLVVGDLYISEPDNKAYYRNSANTAWVPISTTSQYEHSFTGSGSPVGVVTTRPDSSALITGDQYVDLSNDILYFWNGILWEIVSVDRHSLAGNVAPTLTSRTDGTPLIQGDQYVNTSTNELYYWNGSSWIILNSSSDTQSIPDSVEPTVRPNTGSALVEGDVWVNTNYTPTISHTYISGAFVPNGDVSVVASLPASGDYNNQLLILNSTNILYRYDTTAIAWVQVS